MLVIRKTNVIAGNTDLYFLRPGISNLENIDFSGVEAEVLTLVDANDWQNNQYGNSQLTIYKAIGGQYEWLLVWTEDGRQVCGQFHTYEEAARTRVILHTSSVSVQATLEAQFQLVKKQGIYTREAEKFLVYNPNELASSALEANGAILIKKKLVSLCREENCSHQGHVGKEIHSWWSVPKGAMLLRVNSNEYIRMRNGALLVVEGGPLCPRWTTVLE